jgi:hypothetical protein
MRFRIFCATQMPFKHSDPLRFHHSSFILTLPGLPYEMLAVSFEEKSCATPNIDFASLLPGKGPSAPSFNKLASTTYVKFTRGHSHGHHQLSHHLRLTLGGTRLTLDLLDAFTLGHLCYCRVAQAWCIGQPKSYMPSYLILLLVSSSNFTSHYVSIMVDAESSERMSLSHPMSPQDSRAQSDSE